MNIKWDIKKNLPVLEFEDSDFQDAMYVKQMIEGQNYCNKCGTITKNSGWTILQGYFDSARELIIEMGKIGTNSRVKRDLSDLKFAKIDGFDYAVGIPARLVKQAIMMKDAQKQKEVIKNDARRDADEE